MSGKHFEGSKARRLDLAHGRALPDTTGTTAHVHAGTAGLESREDGRSGEGSEAEPEECSGGLGLVATLLGVGGAVCDRVGGGVALDAMSEKRNNRVIV